MRTYSHFWRLAELNYSDVQKHLSGPRRPVIALVVPALAEGGGVPAVADFIARGIEHSGAYDLRCFSLATSSNDKSSVRLRDPRSWSGVQLSLGEWCGRPYVHVGAWIAEIEFMRYRPRKALRAALTGCDLIQVVSGSPAAALSVCGLGKPVSLQCATLAGVERKRLLDSGSGGASAWRRWMTRVTDRLDHEALGRVDAIQIENAWMERLAKSLRPDETSVRFAPPGVDAKIYRPQGERRFDAEGYILCVGRLDDPRKHVELLLEAYARLVNRTADPPRLVLAGSSKPGGAFWSRVAELALGDRVHFVERPGLQELVTLYQGAACFALPSDEEGFGMVVIEAMACGVPVVATRCGGPEGIIADGVDGFLVDLEDAETMADRLHGLCTDYDMNRTMGQAARRTVEQRYSEEITGAAFLETYDALLRKQHTRI